MSRPKLLMAMSGGVDSAVAALLLNKTYDLTGITMRLWAECENVPDTLDTLPDQNAIDAKKIADALGFPHLTVALGESFRKNVVDKFINEYKRGNTPNPCVDCNRCIKFGKLFDIADTMNIPYLATGHYAIITKDANQSYSLHKAKDINKDQSYFLWSIKKERLPYILFPLGEYSKEQIRAIASEQKLASAHRSDSQDICFIPNGDYTAFLEKYGCVDFKEGNFIDTQGNIIGKHSGIERYTIGQRKGLGVSFVVPMFVGKKCALDNTVTLCSDAELYSTTLTANSLNLLSNVDLEHPIRLEAKVRYRHTPAVATVEKIDVDRIKVVFDKPQRAISAGQSVVLYDGDLLVGGGIIE